MMKSTEGAPTEVVIFRMDRSPTARGRGMYEIVTRIVTSIVTGIGGIGGYQGPWDT
jgi:hypothetical protein